MSGDLPSPPPSTAPDCTELETETEAPEITESSVPPCLRGKSGVGHATTRIDRHVLPTRWAYGPGAGGGASASIGASLPSTYRTARQTSPVSRHHVQTPCRTPLSNAPSPFFWPFGQ